MRQVLLVLLDRLYRLFGRAEVEVLRVEFAFVMEICITEGIVRDWDALILHS